MGPELAELLEIPFISYVSEVEEIANGRMRVQRAIEEGHEEIESPLPALITVAKEINVPRLPSLRGRSRAKRAVIPTWDAETLNVDPDRVGLTGSPTRVIKIFLPHIINIFACKRIFPLA